MQAEIAVLRFGLGAKPGDLSAAADEPRAWLMAQIKGAVPLAVNAPLAPSDQIYAGLLAARDERQKDAKVAFNAVREANLPHYRAQVLARAQSAALTSRPFAERLVHFWSNHFAVSADKGVVYGLAGTLENEAIRPHVGGRFVDLLTAVEQHPAMIAFLDNQYSVGKDSGAALLAARFRNEGLRKPARQFGINENLAREILELHTLGVNGGYSQADVTSFAQIITGWSIGGGKGRLAGGCRAASISAITCTSRARKCFWARLTGSRASLRARPCWPIWRAVPKRPTSSPPSSCGISSRTIRRGRWWIASHARS
jgi:uncharacterized protein (DUF1800 family)